MCGQKKTVTGNIQATESEWVLFLLFRPFCQYESFSKQTLKQFNSASKVAVRIRTIVVTFISRSVLSWSKKINYKKQPFQSSGLSMVKYQEAMKYMKLYFTMRQWTDFQSHSSLNEKKKKKIIWWQVNRKSNSPNNWCLIMLNLQVKRKSFNCSSEYIYVTGSQQIILEF